MKYLKNGTTGEEMVSRILEHWGQPHRDMSAGYYYSAVSGNKRLRLKKTDKAFLITFGKYEDYDKQFDLVLVNRADKRLEYIPHAFEGGQR